MDGVGWLVGLWGFEKDGCGIDWSCLEFVISQFINYKTQEIKEFLIQITQSIPTIHSPKHSKPKTTPKSLQLTQIPKHKLKRSFNINIKDLIKTVSSPSSSS